jgi:hypothetical protein
MKRILFITLQFFLFFFIFAVGSFMHPFNLHWGLTVIGPHITRYFVPDGLLLALGVFIAIVVIQALRKRLCNTQWTALAFFLAIAAGYTMKLGFITREL